MHTEHNTECSPYLTPIVANGRGLFLVNRDLRGGMIWRRLSRINDAARAWDGAPEGSLALESWNYAGRWSYVEVKITGRGPVKIPASGGDYGIKGRVRWVGSDDTKEWVECWLSVSNSVVTKEQIAKVIEEASGQRPVR